MASDLRRTAQRVMLATATDEPDWEGEWIDLGGEG